MTYDRLKLLQTYKADDIQEFLHTRHSDLIPAEMQKYILQMNSAATVAKQNRLSVRATIEQLQKEYPDMTYRQARSIFYDALDYFYLDDSVSARAWDMVYAEQFEDMKLVALKANKLEVAYKCAVKAHELRTKARESMDYDWHAPVYMVNINVKPEDLGFTSQKLRDIAKRQEDRKYREMIMGLEISEAERTRLLTEAGIRTEPPTEEADEQ